VILRVRLPAVAEQRGSIGLALQADRPELFSDGWKPNTQYHLRVVVLDEIAGTQYRASGDNCGANVEPYKPCDENGFALELDDSAGKPVGKLAPVVAGACATGGMVPTDVDARVLADGSAATHTGAHHGLVAWDLCWTAPAAGAGTITAYVAAVDGNGGDGTEAFPTDVVNDEVAAGAVPLQELGAPEPDPQSGGCTAAAGEPGLAAGLALLALLALARRRRRAGLAVLLALATVAGCVHVRPRQRETLAKRRMQFAPDRTEDELDLHMQESREGSSGGYGSSGGGCGCN